MDDGRQWWPRLILGIVEIVVGVAVIAWPGATIKVLAALFALDIAVDGGVRVLRGILAPAVSGGVRALFVVGGAVGVVVGLFLLANLPETVKAVVILTGLFWLLTGVLEIVVALVRHGPGMGLAFGLGVLSLVLGSLVLIFPEASLGLLVALVGGSLIVHGAVSAGIAIAYHRRTPSQALRAGRAPGPA
jgi:uncharacterized membrane protein HdeD (DUF308 family)